MGIVVLPAIAQVGPDAGGLDHVGSGIGLLQRLLADAVELLEPTRPGLPLEERGAHHDGRDRGQHQSSEHEAPSAPGRHS